MLQFVQFDEDLKMKINQLEQNCAQEAKNLELRLQKSFQPLGLKLTIELVRTVKGKVANDEEVFTENYESFIEIGVEDDELYHPNAYIPIWRCKQEPFQKVGYMTRFSPNELKEKMMGIVEKMKRDYIHEE